jgi:hypothetical protein
VYATGFPEHFEAGSEIQVVSIPEAYLCADIVAQFVLVHRFDRGGGTDGHENGGFNFSVSGRNESGAGAGAGVGM